MKPSEAKEKGYTHYGAMYRVEIYMTDDEDTKVVGTNWRNEIKLRFFIWIELFFEINDDGFPILKGPKIR